MSTYKPIWGKIIDAKTRGFKGHRSELNSKDAAKGYVYQNVTTTYDDLINKETKNKLSERWPVGGSDNSNKSKKGLTRPKPKPPQYDYFIVPDNYMDSSFKFTAEFDAWWEKDDDKLFKQDKSKNKGWGDLDGKKGHKKIPKGANTTKRHLVMTYNKRTNSLVFTPPIAKSSKPKKKRKNKPAPEPAPEPAPNQHLNQHLNKSLKNVKNALIKDLIKEDVKRGIGPDRKNERIQNLNQRPNQHLN